MNDNYQQTLKQAKEMLNSGRYDGTTIKTLFPELIAHRDYSMKAMAIKALKAPDAQSCLESWGVKPQEVIDWLENIETGCIQEWTKEDEEMLEDVRFSFEKNNQRMTPGLVEEYQKFFDKVRQLKPIRTWTDKDKTTLSNLIWVLKNNNTSNEYVEWLTSLENKINL